jgi:hypothetical protein
MKQTQFRLDIMVGFVHLKRLVQSLDCHLVIFALNVDIG